MLPCSHRVRLIPVVMNYRPRRALAPAAVSLLPGGGPDQRDIHFLGLVLMPAVVDLRSQDKKAASDLLAREGPAGTDDLTPPVVL
jgi:hypothetical protein